jgi:predicted transcriptional regulator
MEVLPFNLRINSLSNGHFQGVKFLGELSPEWALNLYSHEIPKDSLDFLIYFGENDLKSRFNQNFTPNPYFPILSKDGNPTYLLRRIKKEGSDLFMEVDDAYLDKIKIGEYDSSKLLLYVPHNVKIESEELFLRDLWLEWMETAYDSLNNGNSKH